MALASRRPTAGARRLFTCATRRRTAIVAAIAALAAAPPLGVAACTIDQTLAKLPLAGTTCMPVTCTVKYGTGYVYNTAVRARVRRGRCSAPHACAAAGRRRLGSACPRRPRRPQRS